MSYITKAGRAQLERRLADLAEQREIAQKQVHDAREQGDLSENFAYTSGKAKLREIDAQERKILPMLNYILAHPSSADMVEIGSLTHVLIDEVERIFKITGEMEESPHENVKAIAYNTPVAQKLLGCTIGDKVQITTPNGERIYEITAIAIPEE